MKPAWRVRAATLAALFLESCSLFLITATAAVLAGLEQMQMPFWLVMASLSWAYLLSLWVLGLKITPVMRGFAGMVTGIPSLLVLTAWNAGLPWSPFPLLLQGEVAGIGQFVGTMIFLLIIWWRGTEQSREEASLDSIRSAFQVGMVVLLFVGLVDAMTDGRTIDVWLVVGFFAVGLPSLAISRFSADGGEGREMPTRWVRPIFVCVVAILLVGAVVSLLGLGGLDSLTRVAAAIVGSLTYRVLEPIIFAVGLVAGVLVSLGNWLSGLTGGGDIDGLLRAKEGIDAFHEGLRESESESKGGALFSVLQWSTAALGALGATAIVYWLFKARRRTTRYDDVVETRESLFNLERLGKDVAGSMASMAPEWRSGRRSGNRAYRSPRDYYLALLEMASRSSRDREDWETPREHQRRLSGVMPSDPVAHIVDAFQAAHYGAKISGDEEMQALEEDRQALEEFLRDNNRADNSDAKRDNDAGK